MALLILSRVNGELIQMPSSLSSFSVWSRNGNTSFWFKVICYAHPNIVQWDTGYEYKIGVYVILHITRLYSSKIPQNRQPKANKCFAKAIYMFHVACECSRLREFVECLSCKFFQCNFDRLISEMGIYHVLITQTVWENNLEWGLG